LLVFKIIFLSTNVVVVVVEICDTYITCNIILMLVLLLSCYAYVFIMTLSKVFKIAKYI